MNGALVLGVAAGVVAAMLAQADTSVANTSARELRNNPTVVYPKMDVPPDAQTIVRGVAPAGAEVSAFARSNATLEVGDVLPTIELPVSVDEGSGQFEVYADADSLPSEFVESDAYVDVQVVAEQSDGTLWVEHTSAEEVPVDDETYWVSPSAEVPSTQRLSRLGATTLSRKLRGVAVGRLAKVRRTPVLGSGRIEASETQAACSTTVIAKNSFLTRLGEVFPVGNTKAYLVTNGSDGGRYQAAMKVPGKDVEKLEMMHAAGSWGATSAKWSEGRKFVSDTQYYTYDNKYRVADGTCQYYLTYEPHVESGMFESQAADRPAFTNCRPVEDGTDWLRTSGGGSYTVSFGVSAGGVVGVDLAISKDYEDRIYVVHYKIAGNDKMMCGNNGLPGVAHRVMEKRS